MYYFETINILSLFQDMLKIKFKLFTIYFNILNCAKPYFFKIHLKYLVPFILGGLNYYVLAFKINNLTQCTYCVHTFLHCTYIYKKKNCM